MQLLAITVNDTGPGGRYTASGYCASDVGPQVGPASTDGTSAETIEAPAGAMASMRHFPPASVFSLDELLRAGWTVSAVRNAVGHGRVIRVRRGVYALPGSAGTRVEDRAAALTYPGVPLSHLSAAGLRGYPIVGHPKRRTEMTV